MAENIEQSKEARKKIAQATKEFKANRGDPVPLLKIYQASDTIRHRSDTYPTGRDRLPDSACQVR